MEPPEPRPARRDPLRLAARATAILAVAAFFIAAIWAIFARGPWYDEFYTLYVSSPRFSVPEALVGHWLPDNHPPLFYALARATALLGDTAEPRRLLNIAIAAATLAGGWVIVRRLPRLCVPATVLLLTVVAQPLALSEVSELRSYFLSLCALALLALAVVAAWLDQAEQRRSSALVAGTVLVAFNTHIVTTVIAGALVAPFLALALVRGDRKRFRSLALPVGVAAATFVAVTAVQLPLWLHNTGSFWISAGFDAARWPLEHTVMRTLWANPVVTLAGIIGVALLVRRGARERRMPRGLEAILLLGVGAAFAAAVLIAMHLVRPLLVEKYLVGLIPVIAAGLALGFAETGRAIGRKSEALLLAAALAVTLWTLPGNARQAAALASWNGSAALVAEVVEACPASAVHIDPALVNRSAMDLPPGDNREVVPMAYRMVAANHGFALESEQSRRIPHECPALIWGEHDTVHRFTAANVLSHERERGFVFSRLWLYRSGNGWVASDRPLRPSRSKEQNRS